jgi:hypothetical protein
MNDTKKEEDSILCFHFHNTNLIDQKHRQNKTCLKHISGYPAVISQ